MSKQALLLVDLQNDYLPGGAMELYESEASMRKAGAVLDQCRAAGMPIVHIQHVSNRTGATFFLPNTKGVEIADAVRPAAGEAVIQKHFPNSFRDTPLLEHLRKLGVEHLIVCGMMTHMCVDTTVRAAFDLGFSITLVHDACATRDLAFAGTTVPAQSVHTAFMASLNGLFATTVAASELRL